jgi:hypothetical protein
MPPAHVEYPDLSPDQENMVICHGILRRAFEHLTGMSVDLLTSYDSDELLEPKSILDFLNATGALLSENMAFRKVKIRFTYMGLKEEVEALRKTLISQERLLRNVSALLKEQLTETELRSSKALISYDPKPELDSSSKAQIVSILKEIAEAYQTGFHSSSSLGTK